MNSKALPAKLLASGTLKIREIKVIGEWVYFTLQDPRIDKCDRLYRIKPGTALLRMTPIEETGGVKYSINSRVHEYGGGAFWGDEKAVYFCQDSSQRIYQQLPSKKPTALTPANDKKTPTRYADGVMHPTLRQFVCVCEQHLQKNKVNNFLAQINVQHPEKLVTIASGDDFYANPTYRPDGKQLAFLSWNHPNMPWDKTILWLADCNHKGEITHLRKLIDEENVSIYRPQFSPDNKLYFICDKNGFWELACWQNDKIEFLTNEQYDCGLPHWVFGTHTYTFLNDKSIAFLSIKNAQYRIALWQNKKVSYLDLPYTVIFDNLFAFKDGLVFVGATPETFPELIYLDTKNNKQVRLLTTNLEPDTFNQYAFSKAQSISFPTFVPTSKNMILQTVFGNIKEALNNNTIPTNLHKETAQAFFYPPAKNSLPPGQKPPLIVKTHGGPTAMATNSLNLILQYFTSRGFAVLDVNYGGSSGFGRAYRDRLKGLWGVVDVIDCVCAVDYLAKENLIDASKVAIRGGSAGGYTTLCALTFTDVFAVGAIYYGVADLQSLVADTHKFEAHYTDKLVDNPKNTKLYQARSPVHHTKRLDCPMIIFQGLKDKVVPPAQSEQLVKALKAKNIEHHYVTFAEEAHGFKNPSNKAKALAEEYQFYQKILKLPS